MTLRHLSKGAKVRGWLRYLRASDQEILIGFAIYIYIHDRLCGEWDRPKSEQEMTREGEERLFIG